MRRLVICAMLFVWTVGLGLADDGWGRYLNARYGYGIDIPPGFSAIREADNSDGGISRAADGRSELAVWGTNLLNEALRSEVQTRIARDEEDGWQISYKKLTGNWASWSGEREGRIYYARAITLCRDDEAGYFRIEYPAAAREAFDPIVQKLVKGFKHTDCE